MCASAACPGCRPFFYGIGAAVIAIIAIGTYKLTRKTISPTDRLGWGLFGVSALTTAVLETELVWLVLAAGVIYWFVNAPPRSFGSGGLSGLAPAVPRPGWELLGLTVPDSLLWKLALFFTKAGAFVFGSGLAIVPFLYGGVVKEYGWLSEQQFLDAVAVAMITPGPVVITVAFIGYLVAGWAGACVAALATFLPCYLLTILPAPYFKRYGRRPGIKAFVDGVTIAAVGAIAGAIVVLARRQLSPAGQPDWLAVGLALLAGLLLWRFKKLSEPALIASAAVVGILVKLIA